MGYDGLASFTTGVLRRSQDRMRLSLLTRRRSRGMRDLCEGASRVERTWYGHGLISGDVVSRARQRIPLEEGLSLDLNKLVRHDTIERGVRSGDRPVCWVHPHWGEVASGFVSADMSGTHEGWLQVRIADFCQRLRLVAQSRRFGGRQWYFVCPITRRKVSVVWRPEGAARFCSRHAWGQHVAYLSQFGSRIDRAHLGKARISSRLRGKSSLGPWDLPTKPKWMRWKRYKALVGRYHAYQHSLDYLGRPPPT
jgi:hypothetical protein